MRADFARTPVSGADAYVGGLDGARAIAVSAVVVYHFAPSVLPAGFLGVDIFFVVSGFLIARLATREIGRSGTVSLGEFWARRARRLLPALATVTVVVLCVAAVKLSSAEVHDIRAEALGALFYCENWVTIFTKNSYFATLERPSPFLHMWTLAVEEQFYMVFPLVMFASRRAVRGHPVRVAVIALLAAAASTVWMGVLVSPGGDPSRAYLGSDSHAMGLLVGVALGVLAGSDRTWPAFCGWVRSSGAIARAAPPIAAASLVAMLVVMRAANFRTLALYRGGFLLFALLSAFVVAIVVAAPNALISRCLRVRRLVAIGLRSYSIYLWHWPVRVFLTPSSGFDGMSLFAVRMVVSLVLAEVSFRLVERPLRTGRVARRSGSRAAFAYYGTLTIAAIVLVATVDAPRPLLPTNIADLPATFGTAAPSTHKGPNVPTGLPASAAMHVELFGDSTAYMLAIGQVQHADEVPVTLGGDAQAGCSVTPTDRVSEGLVIANPKFCLGWRERWQAAMHNDPRAHLALMTGAWELLDQQTSEGVVRFGTTAWTDLNRTALRTALDVLTSDGRTVSLFEVPCYGTGDVANPLPERSDPRRIAALNQIYTEVARSMPKVQIVHWRTLVCPDGRRVESIGGVHLWLPDEQHLSSAGAVVVWKWWLPQLSGTR